MRVAITGANGRVGSVLLRRLAGSKGVETVGVCRNRVGATVVASHGCEVRIGHISDPASARRLLDDCDVIVNCAFAIGLPRRSRRENDRIVDSLASLGKEHIVHFSSVAVYGQCVDSRRSSFKKPRTDTNYGHLKLALERRIARTQASSSGGCHVLRLGHVYGPNQWLSTQIIGLAQEPDFALPFNGCKPSNAIHVERLAAAIARLIVDPPPFGIYNLTDHPQTSWRQLFDWHTRTLNLNEVRGMDPVRSEALRDGFLRQASGWGFVEGLTAAVRPAVAGGFQAILQGGSLRTLGDRALALLPSYVEDRAKGAYATMSARRQIAELNERTGPKALPWHFSDGMPGPYLGIPQTIPEVEDRPGWLEERLRSWYYASRKIISRGNRSGSHG